MNIKKAGAVVISTGATPYLLIGSQGTIAQSKVFVEGIKKPLSIKNASIVKSLFVDAVAGVWTLTVPNPAAGATLTVVAKGIVPDAPEVDKDIHINCDINASSDLTQSEWVAKIIATFNGNPTAKKLFTATAGGAGEVVFTEITAGVGHSIYAKHYASGVSVVNTTVSKKNTGMTYAQVAKMIADQADGGGSDFDITVLGTLATSDNFNVWTITLPQNTIMKTFGFSENKPVSYDIIVEDSFAITSNGSNFPSRLEQIIKIDATNFAPLYGTAAFTDATIEADDEIVTKAAHGFVTGDNVILTQVTNGTGLTAGGVYEVVRLSSSTFSLRAGNAAVAVSADGTALGFRKITANPLPTGVHYGGDATAAELLCPDFVV
jgi:hypothetical protein